MLQASTVSQVRSQVLAWRKHGDTVVMVPTMGNLHPGHYALIERARELGNRVVASIFVNPSQFGPNEDFEAYPRTLERDADGLAAQGCDLLFHPGVDEVYPYGVERAVSVHVPELADILCGAFRPGHFNGVATVVAKLLNMVQPHIAVFGQKDYQQLLVIRRVVRDLQIDVQIESGKTIREDSGLAMSSRNQYLSNAERERAAELQRCLQWMASQIRVGRPIAEVEAEAQARLIGEGFKVDYVAVRRASDLGQPDDSAPDGRVILLAARLGKARLIDNLLI